MTEPMIQDEGSCLGRVSTRERCCPRTTTTFVKFTGSAAAFFSIAGWTYRV